MKWVCEIIKVDSSEIKRIIKRSKLSQARSLIIYFGNKEFGISGSELARYFGVNRSSISEAIVRSQKIANENEYRIA